MDDETQNDGLPVFETVPPKKPWWLLVVVPIVLLLIAIVWYFVVPLVNPKSETEEVAEPQETGMAEESRTGQLDRVEAAKDLFAEGDRQQALDELERLVDETDGTYTHAEFHAKLNYASALLRSNPEQAIAIYTNLTKDSNTPNFYAYKAVEHVMWYLVEFGDQLSLAFVQENIFSDRGFAFLPPQTIADQSDVKTAATAGFTYINQREPMPVSLSYEVRLKAEALVDVAENGESVDQAATVVTNDIELLNSMLEKELSQTTQGAYNSDYFNALVNLEIAYYYLNRMDTVTETDFLAATKRTEDYGSQFKDGLDRYDYVENMVLHGVVTLCGVYQNEAVESLETATAMTAIGNINMIGESTNGVSEILSVHKSAEAPCHEALAVAANSASPELKQTLLNHGGWVAADF